MDEAAVGVVADAHAAKREVNRVAEDPVWNTLDSQVDRATSGVVAAMPASDDAGISIARDDSEGSPWEVAGEGDEHGGQSPMNGVVRVRSNTAKKISQFGQRFGPKLTARIEDLELQPLAGVEVF